MTIKIANGAGFLGDNLDAPRLLVESAQVDYLTLEYLAELTMSILARQREKNPAAGYAADFLDVLKSLIPALKAQPQLKIVTNAGGVNPSACATAAGKILRCGGIGRHYRSASSAATICCRGSRNCNRQAAISRIWIPVSR